MSTAGWPCSTIDRSVQECSRRPAAASGCSRTAGSNCPSTGNGRLDREATGVRVYTVHIVNARTTYSSRGRFHCAASPIRQLTVPDPGDFLASYEPWPGTVVYAGYGSLLEERQYIDGQWFAGTDPSQRAGAACSSRRHTSTASDCSAVRALPSPIRLVAPTRGSARSPDRR